MAALTFVLHQTSQGKWQAQADPPNDTYAIAAADTREDCIKEIRHYCQLTGHTHTIITL